VPSSKPKPIYYWDTDVFLAWIKNEQRSPEDRSGIAEIAEKVHRNEAVLITSAFFLAELVECNLPAGTMDKIGQLFKRRNIQMKVTDQRVSTLASQIRNHYLEKRRLEGKKGTVSTPDAIHLATAIHYQVDEFHTYDDGGKDGISILALNGDVAGHELIIRKPPVKQMRLPGLEL